MRQSVRRQEEELNAEKKRFLGIVQHAEVEASSSSSSFPVTLVMVGEAALGRKREKAKVDIEGQIWLEILCRCLWVPGHVWPGVYKSHERPASVGAFSPPDLPPPVRVLASLALPSP